MRAAFVLEGRRNHGEGPVKTSSYCQRNCHVKRVWSPCKVLDEESDCEETPVYELTKVVPNMSSSSHTYVFAATHGWKRLVVIMLFNFMQHQVLPLRENVESDSAIRD